MVPQKGPGDLPALPMLCMTLYEGDNMDRMCVFVCVQKLAQDAACRSCVCAPDTGFISTNDGRQASSAIHVQVPA